MALRAGQFQIGSSGTIFGKGTVFPVEKVDFQAYEINAQDFQVTQSDENRFGRDSFKPSSIIFTMAALINRVLPNMEAMGGLSYATIDNSVFGTFQSDWRGDSIRSSWGVVTSLGICSRDGVTRYAFGRPRRFQYTYPTMNAEFINITAEFKCADTLLYSESGYSVMLETPNHGYVISRE